MSMKQCSKGHLYDESKNTYCPYCAGENKIGKSIPLYSDNGKTEYLDHIEANEIDEISETRPIDEIDFGKTQFIDDFKNSEIKPVKGWLVVIQGKKCGLDYRIHSGQNTVGRSKKNDIGIEFDDSISNEGCCSIIYDDRDNSFYLKLGDSQNNIHINGNILLNPVKMKDSDIIEIGRTKLVFRALYNDSFKPNM